MEFPAGEDITDSNRELLLHIIDDLHDLARTVGQLTREWEKYEPVVSAFGRGGLLAARAAAKNGNRT